MPDEGLQRAAQRRSTQTCVRLPWQAQPHPHGLAEPGRPDRALPAVAGFSTHAVATARDIGVLPLLERFAEAADRPVASDAVRLQRLQARQRLGDRVLLALLDVQGVVAELECERDRGERLEFMLAQAQDRRDRRLALSGLIVGALTTIVSGGLAIGTPDGNAADVLGIVGGSAEAGVGAVGLGGDGPGTLLRTERNLLREIWEGPAVSRLLPPMVWRLLTEPVGGDGNGRSIRQELVAQWRADHRLDDPASPDGRRHVALLFGDGGRYSLEALQLREMLLDSVQARVWLVSMDLERLLREIIERPEPGAP